MPQVPHDLGLHDATAVTKRRFASLFSSSSWRLPSWDAAWRAGIERLRGARERLNGLHFDCGKNDRGSGLSFRLVGAVGPGYPGFNGIQYDRAICYICGREQWRET
jgi:hypothetical protein